MQVACQVDGKAVKRCAVKYSIEPKTTNIIILNKLDIAIIY